MKRLLCILLFSFLTKLSFGQKPSIVGAWYWSDSIKEISMFFKQDGSVSMHAGPKGGTILPQNLKNGRYVLAAKLLTIKWSDNKIEKDAIRFTDKHSFVLTTDNKTALTFKRVVDEEVVEEK